MSTEAVDFYINDSSPLANPVSGVTVKITSQEGKVFYTQGVTDALGHAGFSLPSGVTYQARFYKFQAGFVQPQLFMVLPSPLTPPQTNTFKVTAQVLTPPVPLDARLCTAYGFFRDVTGAPQPYVEIHFIAKFDPVWLDGAAVVKERVIIRSDETGYAQVNLIRNGHFDVTIQGEEDIVRHIKVPDAPNVSLPDLLFPIISQVVATPAGPYAMNKGDLLAVDLDVYASDGEKIHHHGFGQIRFCMSDPTILSYQWSPGGLILVAMGPGTATITVERADHSIIHIPDAGVQNGVLQATVS